MQKSDSIGKLAAALVQFQGAVGKVKKDAKNPFFKSKYASLANILDVIQAPLSASGLAVSQLPDEGDTLTTILMHAESGEYISASYQIHAAKTDPQGVGSAITYARRYGIGAVLSLNIDDDDDGNAATHPRGNVTTPTPMQPVDPNLSGTSNSASAFKKKYGTDKEIAEALDKATSVQDVGNLYYINAEAVESNAELKAKFSEKKNGFYNKPTDFPPVDTSQAA